MAVVFDSVGGGSFTDTTATPSWAHTLGTDADALVVLVTANEQTVDTNKISSVTVGPSADSATALELLGFVYCTSYFAETFYEIAAVYGLLDPPTGAQNIYVTTTYPTTTSTFYQSVGGSSVAYTGVASFGTLASANVNNGSYEALSSQAIALALTSQTGGMGVFFVTCNAGTAISDVSGTTRVNSPGAHNYATVIADAAGAATIDFSATGTGMSCWVAAGLPLVPTTSVSVAPASAVVTITPQTPTVVVTDNIVVSPESAVVEIATGTPDIVATDNVVVSPQSAVVEIVGGTSDINASGNLAISPQSAVVEIAGGIPEVTNGLVVSPESATIRIVGGIPDVVVTDHVVISPDSAVVEITGGTSEIGVTGSAESSQQSYLGAFTPSITVQHKAVIYGSTDGHGNQAWSYADPIARQVMTVYPLHKMPHHDVVGYEYVARVLMDFIMEVPDASVYHKNDLVTWDDMVFAVQGFPFNWSGYDPFGFDSTFFGGSVHLLRVT